VNGRAAAAARESAKVKGTAVWIPLLVPGLVRRRSERNKPQEVRI